MAVAFAYRLPIRPMSCRRKHHHGHANSAASSLSLQSDAPAAMPVEALAPPAFSVLLAAHLGESHLQSLSLAGFLDDADVAGLTAHELCGLCSALPHSDAVAALLVAQHHKRLSSLPERSAVRVVAEQHPPSTKVRRTLFRPTASSLSPITDGKAKLLDEFRKIYVQLGDKGFRFSPLFHSQPDGVRDSFCRGLAKIEEGTLKQQLSIWRRWTKFDAGFMPPPLQPWLPTLEATYAFLQDQSVRGPTVARGLFQGMSWWSRHIGVPFPLQDPFVTAWSQIQGNHVAQQSKPLAIGSLFLLCQLAVGPFTPLAAFCFFALMPLVCCLRLAHLQRSPGVHQDGNYLIGLCTGGKARKNGGRPPFQWSGPINVLGYSNVFQHALRVHSNMMQQFPKMDFVVPDIDASLLVLQASLMLPLGCRVNCFCLSLSSFCRLYFLGQGLIQRRLHLLPPTASAALCPRLLTCAAVQKSWPYTSATGPSAQAKPIVNSRCNITTRTIGLGPLQTQSIICWLCSFRPRADWGRRVLIGRPSVMLTLTGTLLWPLPLPLYPLQKIPVTLLQVPRPALLLRARLAMRQFSGFGLHLPIAMWYTSFARGRLICIPFAVPRHWLMFQWSGVLGSRKTIPCANVALRQHPRGSCVPSSEADLRIKNLVCQMLLAQLCTQLISVFATCRTLHHCRCLCPLSL